MPDLTVERYWVCTDYADWLRQPCIYEDGQHDPVALRPCPPCRWHQFHDGGRLDNGACPKCGGGIVSVAIGT